MFPSTNPADRPRTTRETVRVIMIDHDRTLLFEDSDPGVPDAQWWVTPGGQIEPDETMTQAAIREVAEETGYSLSEADLRGPIAFRHVVHGYSDQVIEQDEAFFLAMVQPFEVDISAHTPDEQKTMLQHRWWSTTTCGIPTSGSGRSSSWSCGRWSASPTAGRSTSVPRRSRPSPTPTESPMSTLGGVAGSSAFEGVPVLGAVKVVPPVGGSILTAPALRRGWR